MPMTNYPNGFLAGLSVRGVPLLQAQPGNVYWVDNSPPGPTGIGVLPQVGGLSTQYGTRFTGGSDNNPGTFQKPLATIAQALNLCSQDSGDIIFVKPGHLEIVNASPSTTQAANMAPVYDPTGSFVVSIGGAAGYNFQMDVAGVAIIGLGLGNLRPQIVWGTAAGANILVTAAQMSIQNFLFSGNFLNVASAFTITDASSTSSSITGNTYTAGTTTRKIYPGAQLVPTSANGILPGTTILAPLGTTTTGAGTYLVSESYQVATSSATVIAGAMDFDIEGCEVRDLGTALNLMVLVTTGGGAGGSDGLRVFGNKFNSNATAASASGTLITLGGAVDRMVVNNNTVNSTATSTGAALVVAGANNMTNVEIAQNKLYKPTTAATGSLVTSSSTASSGIMSDNYAWTLATSTGLIITTGTKLGFVNNYGTITGANDKSALINPVAV